MQDQRAGHPLDALRPVVSLGGDRRAARGGRRRLRRPDRCSAGSSTLIRATRDVEFVSLGRVGPRQPRARARRTRAGRSCTAATTSSRTTSSSSSRPSSAHRLLIDAGVPRRDATSSARRDRCAASGALSRARAAPAPDWERSGVRRRSRARSERRGRAFPLIPRRRVVGSPFGAQRSARRGRGARRRARAPTCPGDPIVDDRVGRVRAALGRARHRRVHRARAVRRGGAASSRSCSTGARRWGSTARPFPWLDKPTAAAAVVGPIVASADAARGDVGARRSRRATASRRSAAAARAARCDGLDAGERAAFDAPGGRPRRALARLLGSGAGAAAGQLRLRRLGLPRAAPSTPRCGSARGLAPGRRAGDRPGPDLGAQLPDAARGAAADRRRGDRRSSLTARLTRREVRARARRTRARYAELVAEFAQRRHGSGRRSTTRSPRACSGASSPGPSGGGGCCGGPR